VVEITEITLKKGDTVLISNDDEFPYLYKRVSCEDIRKLAFPEKRFQYLYSLPHYTKAAQLDGLKHVIS
jgi:hypothetical protein